MHPHTQLPRPTPNQTPNSPWAGALAAALLLALAPPESLAAGFPVPGLRLVGNTRGEAAIRGLGDQLPEVARAHGRTAAELAHELRHDHTLNADAEGRLHFIDEPPALGLLTTSATLPPIEVAHPLADTFQLHSRPGSKRTIYLDFDGHVLTRTAWNYAYLGGANLTAPPFDLDGIPLEFNDTERTRIQQVWKRVAEDFAAFDVDVTTELTSESILTRSSSTDEVYGVRVLISPISHRIANAGGVSYLSTFDDVGDYYKPSLVFPEKLQFDARNIGEACSHEAGHALGLGHDGTTTGAVYYAGHGSGETSWAPIMGNSYSKNVTQWSKGEYANANNKQDDIAVIQAHGLSPVTDDHGDSPLSAAYIDATSAFHVSGILGLSDDTDVLAFATGSGEVSLSLKPASLGPNLDISADLLDASGTLLASQNPASLLGASFNLFLNEGTYFVRVRATGTGNPASSGYSTYASQGNYTLTGTVIDPTGSVPPVAVASATPASVVGTTPVTFDGSASFDPDGTVVSHAWDLGDGTSANGTTVSHSYTNPGSYTATLTVTDNAGNVAQDSVSIDVVAPNQPPVAVIWTSSTAGTTPLVVVLDASGSADPDGAITSYAWDFGDGSPVQTGANVQHTYQTPGTYTATLTVTDDRGASASTSTTLAVSPDPTTVLRVSSLVLTPRQSTVGTTGLVTVTVTDLTGTPVAGASVIGRWSGIAQGTSTGPTGSSGTVFLVSKRTRQSGPLTFTILNVSKPGYTFSATDSPVTSSSVQAGPGR